MVTSEFTFLFHEKGGFGGIFLLNYANAKAFMETRNLNFIVLRYACKMTGY